MVTRGMPRRILAFGVPVDMRKSFDGLLGLVRGELKEDPLSGSLFVFVNRRGNYLKAIYWDRTGYCLFAKRLLRGKFKFPLEDRIQELNRQIFFLLLDGLVVSRKAETCN